MCLVMVHKVNVTEVSEGGRGSWRRWLFVNRAHSGKHHHATFRRHIKHELNRPTQHCSSSTGETTSCTCTQSYSQAVFSMSWKSPLIGYENAEPLPTTFNADGKSLFNPAGPKSRAYDEFPEPIDSSNNGFDFHSKWLVY